jgi:hypothetical protein
MACGRVLVTPLLAVLTVAALAGCGSAPAAAGPVKPAVTAPPAATAGPTRTLTAVLLPINGGNIKATLTVTVGAGTYALHVDAQSLVPGARYPVKTIGGGPCGTPFLPPIQDVGDLVADASGNASVERIYTRAYKTGAIIGIGDHVAEVGEFERKLISCADLPAA